MIEKVVGFVKRHKKGFVRGGLFAVGALGTMLVVSKVKGSEEPTLIEEPEYEISETNEEVTDDIVERTDIE